MSHHITIILLLSCVAPLTCFSSRSCFVCLFSSFFFSPFALFPPPPSLPSSPISQYAHPRLIAFATGEDAHQQPTGPVNPNVELRRRVGGSGHVIPLNVGEQIALWEEERHRYVLRVKMFLYNIVMCLLELTNVAIRSSSFISLVIILPFFLPAPSLLTFIQS